MANFKLDSDYIDVAARIVEFRTKHPEGSLQQVSIDFREVAGGAWVVYTAAAYRTPDDSRPGIGTAWEPIPGRTNFTRDSEVQNAETAAWGRAIVASLSADTKKGIASAEEVRNAKARQAEREQRTPAEQARVDLAAYCTTKGLALSEVAADFATKYGHAIPDATAEHVTEFMTQLKATP